METQKWFQSCYNLVRGMTRQKCEPLSISAVYRRRNAAVINACRDAAKSQPCLPSWPCPGRKHRSRTTLLSTSCWLHCIPHPSLILHHGCSNCTRYEKMVSSWQNVFSLRSLMCLSMLFASRYAIVILPLISGEIKNAGNQRLNWTSVCVRGSYE